MTATPSSIPEAQSEIRAGAGTLAFHRQQIVFDCLALYYLLDQPYVDRALEGGVTGVNLTFVIEEEWDEALRRIETGLDKIARNPNLVHATCAGDIVEAKRAGKLAVVIGTQGCTCIGKEFWRLGILARLGTRFLQLTYSPANLYGDGCGETRDAGLTFLGKDLIAAVNEQPMMLDLSHCGHRTSREAIALARAPVFTHANAYAVHSNDRNKKDESIRAIVEKGGMIGVCALPRAVRNERPSLEDMLDHLQHIDRLVGVENVGIGLDFIEGYSGAGGKILPDSYRWRTLRPDVWGTVEDFYHQKYPDGLDTIRKLPNLTQGLFDRGYAPDAVAGVLGANWLRTMQRCVG